MEKRRKINKKKYTSGTPEVREFKMKKDTLALIISIVGVVVILLVLGIGLYFQFFR